MEQANFLTLTGLKARGHRIEVLSLNPLGELGPLLSEAGIPASGLKYKGRGGWQSFYFLLRDLRARECDAILLTGHNFLASAAIAMVPASRKIMSIHFHHFEPGVSGRHWPWTYGLADKVFDSITFCTDFIRKEALAIRPSLAGKSLTVPNAFLVPEVPSRHDRAKARAALGLDPWTVTVGNAGWLIKRKRFDIFLEVAAEVLRSAPSVVFLIAGDGPERSDLEAQTRRLGIQGNVRFLGWQPDLEHFYKAIDVLLFNSDFDALGRTPAEAAALGVPVIASVVAGGMRELFRDADEALVLNSHCVNQLAETVLGLACDETRRLNLGAGARARVAEYGDLTRHVDEFERLLY